FPDRESLSKVATNPFFIRISRASTIRNSFSTIINPPAFTGSGWGNTPVLRAVDMDYAYKTHLIKRRRNTDSALWNNRRRLPKPLANSTGLCSYSSILR
ncbi:MAG: hypothetical protein DRP87_09610, partial [Spirochaetes bacterium]